MGYFFAGSGFYHLILSLRELFTYRSCDLPAPKAACFLTLCRETDCHRGCEKSPPSSRTQEYQHRRGRRPGGPAEKSSKHVFAPGKFVQQYVFAGGCLHDFGLYRTGRRGEGELPQRGKRGRPGPRRPLHCLLTFFTAPLQ